jgi:hypothetical protein
VVVSVAGWYRGVKSRWVMPCNYWSYRSSISIRNSLLHNIQATSAVSTLS